MSTHGRHTSRAARTEAARQLDAARARTRAWLSITAACVLLGLASPLVLPPLTVAFAALAALAASRWRHYHRATGALTRRRPRPTPPTTSRSERRADDNAAGNGTRAH
jgi:hypothetical protein